MVPVSLRLQNFLSYGTAADTLDFEQFRVACLSGRNGQGKSALLDSITWALWGEARKTSDSRKPDDALVRTGTRHMEVEFVFDIDDNRYRVLRSYQRSKSGKTSKPGLELNVFEPTTAAYRPITRPSIRETQEALENLLGLDFNTFINSAFLLQGRSDEFTKKKPTERKEILARILNLDKYERLAEKARDREKELAERALFATNEIERLKRALCDQPKFEDREKAVAQSIAGEEKRMGELRAKERTVTDRLAAMAARVGEAVSLKEAVEGLNSRLNADEEEIGLLDGQIEAAEAIVKRQKQVESAFDVYQSQKKVEEELNQKQYLYFGVEKQLQAQKSTLKDQRNAFDLRVQRLEHELKTTGEQIGQCDIQMADRKAIALKLKAALNARDTLVNLTALMEEKKSLERERLILEKDLLSLEETTKGSIRAAEEIVKREEEIRRALKDLDAAHVRLVKDEERVAALTVERDKTVESGTDLAKNINTLLGKVKAAEEALSQEQARLHRLLTLADEYCPTCGTALTPEHRKEVETQFRKRIAEIEKALANDRTWLEDRNRERKALLASFKRIEAQLNQFSSLAGDLAANSATRAQYKETLREIAAKRDEAARLRKLLDSKSFGQDKRARIAEIDRAMSASSFDEAEYERCKAEAAKVEPYEEQRLRLEAVEERKLTLQKQQESSRIELSALRMRLDSGEAFGDIQNQIDRLQPVR